MSNESIKVLTGPAYEPISRAEAKSWLRIDDTGVAATDAAVNALIDMLIKAMREQAENLTFRAFISRQVCLYLADWPWHREYGVQIYLPHPPLISVDSFKYIDTDGVLQTLATDQYVVHDEYEPAFVIPEWEVTWPTIRRLPNALQITYTCGYAPGSPSDEASNQEVMPAALRLWMQAKVATHNEFREAIVSGSTVSEIPRDYTDRLLDALVIGTRLF